MKSSFAICVLLPLLAFAGGGRARDSHPNDSREMRPTAVSINGKTGRGVLLSNSSTGNVFLLTARHVATSDGLFRHDIDLAFECLDGTKVHRQLKGGETRWLTTAKPELDLAWIGLREDELPDRVNFKHADIDSFSGEALSGSVSNKVLIAAYCDRGAVLVGFGSAKDVRFSGNQELLCVTQEVGYLNVTIPHSESGSPVFGLSDDGRYAELIGIVTVGCETQNVGGFIPVLGIADKLQDNFLGYLMTRLCDCKELW